MEDLWMMYGGFMEDLWKIYGGNTEIGRFNEDL